MRLLCFCLLMGLISTGLALAQKEDEAAKAAALLKLARAAIGSEAKLQALTSLTINGTMQRQAPATIVNGGPSGGPSSGNAQAPTMSGDLQFDFLLPDKILKSETISPMSGIEITRLLALNGNEVWTDTQNTAPAGANVMFRAASPTTGVQQETAMRIDIARFTLGFLLTAPSGLPVEYKFAGVAENPDGKKADVIQIKHDGKIVIGELFLDQQTHEPWMLSYQARKGGGVQMRTTSFDRPPTPEEIERMQKEAQARAEAQPLVEYQLRFSDFKTEGGLKFPHRVTRTLGDDIVEEWEFNKFKINPGLKAELFIKKK